MIIFKIPVVITTGGLWLLMMFLIDITNLIAQVCSSIPLVSRRRRLNCGILKRLTLLSLGFQRETASRGSIAVYTLACVFSVRIVHLF
jgi:hypothetical protein